MKPRQAQGRDQGHLALVGFRAKDCAFLQPNLRRFQGLRTRQQDCPVGVRAGEEETLGWLPLGVKAVGTSPQRRKLKSWGRG